MGRLLGSLGLAWFAQGFNSLNTLADGQAPRMREWVASGMIYRF